MNAYAMMEESWEREKRITVINDDLDMCDYYINKTSEERQYTEQMDCLRTSSADCLQSYSSTSSADCLQSHSSTSSADCLQSYSSTSSAEDRQKDLDKISIADMCQAGWNRQEGKATVEDLKILELCSMVEEDNRQNSDPLPDVYSQNRLLTVEIDKLSAEVERLTSRLTEQTQLNDLLFENVQRVFNKQFQTSREICSFIQSEEYKQNEEALRQCLMEYWQIKQLFDNTDELQMVDLDDEAEYYDGQDYDGQTQDQDTFRIDEVDL